MTLKEDFEIVYREWFNNRFHHLKYDQDCSSLDKKKVLEILSTISKDFKHIDDVEKKIDELDFSNIIRLSSDVGACVIEERTKELIKQSIQKVK